MNLAELKKSIDDYYKSVTENGTSPEDISVLINLSEPSIGPSASTEIESILLGFDWEANQLRIQPTKKIASLGKRLDDVSPCVQKPHRDTSLYWCPRCTNQVKEADNFCKSCGQKMR